MTAWQTARIGEAYDVLAPDGSEIRTLVSVAGASLVHCTLPPGQVTQAVRHRTVEEIWYCVGGTGQVWRQADSHEEVADMAPGVALSIPPGAAFQFRSTGQAPLEVVIATIPPWPGPEEAIATSGPWQATL